MNFLRSPGLTHHAVPTLGSLMSYVEEGTKARKTASTLQNPSSSRSHALLTIAVSPETPSVAVASSSAPSSPRRKSEPWPRGGSKLRLVDLAGSESAATCSGVHRLKVSHFLKIISLAPCRGRTGIDRLGSRFPKRDDDLFDFLVGGRHREGNERKVPRGRWKIKRG